MAGASSLGLATTQLPAASAPHDRGQQQLDRVVPGGDDEDHAERVLHRVGARRAQPLRYGHGLRPQPLRQVLQGVVDLAHGEVDLGAVGLLGPLAEVGVERGGQLVTAFGQQRAQGFELLATPGQRLRTAGGEGGAQPCDDVRGRFRGVVRHAMSPEGRAARAAAPTPFDVYSN
ncbi:hypothetical protein GCM10020254_19840 [Streptomyces goshikiensis]